MDLFLLLASILASASVLMLFVSVLALNSGRTVRRRLQQYMAGETTEPVTLQELELAQPFSERVVLPILRRVSRLFGWIMPQNRLHALRLRLTMAGNPGGITAIDFVGVKGLGLVITTALAVAISLLAGLELSISNIALLGAVAMLGFVLPDFWLGRKVTERQRNIVNALPDAFDMLVITVEAGLSFEQGLQEITAKWKDDLSREFDRVLRDIRTGMSRRQALLALAERNGVSDLSTFVAAINQAEELGVSIGRVLKVQAEEMRVRRRQRAQEKANQAPIKMMFPLVFLIFPALFAVLLGPAVPQLITSLGGL